MQKLPILFAALLLFSFGTKAQQPQKLNSAEIYHQIQKLNFLGSVLYIAAHPDDENTRLISYFSNEMNFRTGYLSLTRGDGGQNLIGPELRELLGVIRTQELIEARKIDGGEQFFSRANDFGYSKTPAETLEIWDKDKVLSDVVWAIRKFQPDVIINRFDARTPGTTHGHHTASAVLSLEGIDKASDNSAFPNQLSLVKTWQPKRVFFNTSYWFYGGQDKFDKADKSKLYSLQTGAYYKSLGKSNQEIAALSRSRHQSQGFGTSGVRGEDIEYLELIKGDAPQDKSNIFEGIDTSWNRVVGGKPIGILLAEVEKNFDFKNPEASIPDLVKAYKMIQSLDDSHWKQIKTEDIKKVIAACAGLYLDAVAETPDATPGSTIKVKLEAINRSNVPMNLQRCTFLPDKKIWENDAKNSPLLNNFVVTFESEIPLPATLNYTQPYWLKDPASVGMYTVKDQQNIGIPDVIREVKAVFDISINGTVIPFERNIVYKYNDNTQGEVYEPFDVIPDVTTSITDKVNIFARRKTKTVEVKVKAGKDNLKGNVSLEVPENWQVSPSEIPFLLAKKGEEQIVDFVITAPKNADEISAKCVATVDGKRFDREQIDIRYSHISKQMVLKPSEAKFIKLDIKTGDEKIAYIMGAGDEVNKSLMQMGYDVTVLKPIEITKERLAGFDVVITGIRAYNTVKDLASKQLILMDFVKEGKTMIVQYNTADAFVTKDIAPFPLKISRDRVTEENAEVRFLAPENRVLNRPNKITPADFKGWKQEQGLYYPNEWDKAFTAVLSANDKDETPKNGALLIAKYGKGHYIYTGLSFFRELPEGVSGAFRLMANLISIGN
jgi:LmbE family N-acetylglucosaminyl deacetylase